MFHFGFALKTECPGRAAGGLPAAPARGRLPRVFGFCPRPPRLGARVPACPAFCGFLNLGFGVCAACRGVRGLGFGLPAAGFCGLGFAGRAAGFRALGFRVWPCASSGALPSPGLAMGLGGSCCPAAARAGFAVRLICESLSFFLYLFFISDAWRPDLTYCMRQDETTRGLRPRGCNLPLAPSAQNAS